MDKDLTEILIIGAKELGIELEARQIEAFSIYLEELKKWNTKINLTSLRSDRDIVIRHFLDSLIPVRFIKEGRTLLDIGSGAGFPGIPIKLVLPRLNVTLLEGVEKKVHFLRHIIRTLGLKDISPIWARAEDKAVIAVYKESFDCIISRALTQIHDFLKLARPYQKKGGLIIAMKGPFEKRLKDELKGYSLFLYSGAGRPTSLRGTYSAGNPDPCFGHPSERMGRGARGWVGSGAPLAELHEVPIPFTKQKTSIVIFI